MNAEYDLKIDDAIAQITLKIDNEICDTWKIKREDAIKALQAQKRIDKAIEKLYCWGETLDPDFQKKMLLILQDEKVDD